MPNQLLLHDVHRERGASFGEIDGWEVPLHYGDPAAEYRAMREGAGVIDRSMLGKVTVTGRDRQAFLQGMLTNDVKGLTAGKGTGAAFLDALGKVMVLLSVYALDDRLLIELPPELHREDARAARPLSHLGEGVLRGRRFGLRHRRRPGAGRRLICCRGLRGRRLTSRRTSTWKWSSRASPCA